MEENEKEKGSDKLARLEYKMYRLVAFIISMYLMFRLLDEHIHISKFVLTLSGKIARLSVSLIQISAFVWM